MLKDEKVGNNPPTAESEVVKLVIDDITLVKANAKAIPCKAEQTAQEHKNEKMIVILKNTQASGLVRLIDIKNN